MDVNHNTGNEEMHTPIHSINIDLSHSSEAKALFMVVENRLSRLGTSSPEFGFLHPIYEQLKSDIELLESLEE